MLIFLKTFWQQPFFRFLFVGGLNTLFGYLVLALLLFLKVNLPLAIFFGMVIGIIFNFFTTGKVVFQSFTRWQFIKFIFIYLMIYLTNVTMIKIVQHHQFNYYFSIVLVMIPMSFITYFLLKMVVFTKNTKIEKI